MLITFLIECAITEDIRSALQQTQRISSIHERIQRPNLCEIVRLPNRQTAL